MRRIRPLVASLALLLVVGVPGHRATAATTYPPPATPDFACSDSTYSQAVKTGITLGISPDSPYTFLDPKTKNPAGIDWDINNAVLKFIGIKTVKYQIMPFDSLIPALQSKRIDVIGDNIHQTPARLKVITFTSPAWWYGPALIVQKGNPKHVSSYNDLKSLSVGAITGSAADEYLTSIGLKITSFQDNTSEFLSVAQKRVDVVLEDDTKFAAFKKENANAPIDVLNITPPPLLISTYGYSYARYGLRKSDCTLNFAYSRGLAELRANGTIGAILASYGLPTRNLYLPGV